MERVTTFGVDLTQIVLKLMPNSNSLDSGTTLDDHWPAPGFSCIEAEDATPMAAQGCAFRVRCRARRLHSSICSPNHVMARTSQ